MNDINSFLAGWAIRYLENKDTLRKTIINIEKDANNSDFVIHYKDKAVYFIIRPTLETCIFKEINGDNHCGIFALNNPSNTRFIVNQWVKLVEFRSLSIYLINPFSASDKIWTISPYIHDRICDKSSLEMGLKSMAEMVIPIGIAELNNKIRLLKEAPGL